MYILFKNDRYIIYPINLIENKNVNEVREFSFFITSIKYNIRDIFPKFPNIKWDVVLSNNKSLFIFKNDLMYIYNIENQTHKKIKMSYQYKNLWKLNINNI
ncbi:hypothetical protein N9T73_00150 [bacterium]|nr:hypothetical protein [bacterium]